MLVRQPLAKFVSNVGSRNSSFLGGKEGKYRKKDLAY